MRYIFVLILIFFCIPSQMQSKQRKTIDQLPIPKTIEKCFEILDETMSEQEKILIRALPEDSISFHKEFQYGTDFYHAWKIYDGSKLTNYFNRKGLYQPSEIYETILISYHRYLNKEKVNLEQQIEKYNEKERKELFVNFEKSFKEQNEKLLYKGIRTCLLAYIQKRKEFIAEGIIKSSNDLIISIDGFPPNFYFETTIDGFAINYISLINYQSLKKELRKGISVLSLSKIELNKNILEIGVANYNVELFGDNHLNMNYVDSITCIYEYSPENQNWILIETNYGSV